MSRRHGPVLARALALALSLAAARTAHGTPSGSATGAFRIDYLAGGSAYVGVGTDDSLGVGDSLRVVRDGATIALLKAAFVSRRRAVCDTLWTRMALAVGDRLVLTRALPPPAAGSGPSPAAEMYAGSDSSAGRPARAWVRDAHAPRLRGRVGGRWLSVETNGGGRFQQPALDLRVDGTNAGAGHLDLSVDVRTRRTTRNFTGAEQQVDFQSRFYRASLTVRSFDANRRITLGRQSSPTLASISLFDGGLLEWGDATRTLGMFGGTQPDPSGYRLSSEVVESGAFVEWHQKPLSTQRWSIATGGVTSQDHGRPNRDFMFAQGWWFSNTTNAWVTQELDVNRGWKRDAGESALAPTSTFANLRVSVREWWALTGGYDNRRNVRLYRDRLTPETEFDDAYRQGAWFGAQITMTNHARLSGEVRSNAGADRSHSWSTNAELYRFAPLNATARARMSRYSGTSLDSWLESGSLALDPLPLWHLEAAGGVRSTRDAIVAIEDREYWQTIDCDLTVGRSWYLNGGWERDYGGGTSDTRQLQAGLSWRF